MDVSKARAGLFSMKIEIGHFFNVEKSKAWIEIREMGLKESREFTALKDEERADWLLGKLEVLTLDHNFFDCDQNGNEVKATVGTVIELLTISCAAYIVKEMFAGNPLERRDTPNADR